MKYTTHKKLGKNWSAITLGCWQLAPSEGWGDLCSAKDAEAVVKNALDNGITAFDTAEGYGDGESERRLGKALGSQKDDVIVISKIWPDADFTKEAFEQRMDDTLKALGRDYVDVYLYHWPPDEFTTKDHGQKLTDFMLYLKEKGKTKIFGVSNFRKKDLHLLGDNLPEYSINEIPYNLVQREYEGSECELCSKAGLEYMVYAPTAKGFLARELSKEDLSYRARNNKDFFHEPLYSEAKKVFNKVKEIADSINRKPIEVAITWVLNQPNVLTAIVGSRKPNQVPEFSSAGDCELSSEHLEQLTKVSDLFLEARERLKIGSTDF